MPRAELVTKGDVAHTLQWLCEKYNEAVGEEKSKRDADNMLLAAAYSKGEIDVQSLASKWQPRLPCLNVKDFQHLATKFTRNHGYTKQATNTSGQYLEFNDIKMQERLALRYRPKSIVDGSTCSSGKQCSCRAVVMLIWVSRLL